MEGWEPDLASRRELPVFITHGRRDPIIDPSFGRGAHELLAAAGLPVTYLESDVAHQIDPVHLRPASDWLAAATPERPA